LARRKGIQAVKKTDWWGTGVFVCMGLGADLDMVQLMPPLPLTVCCCSKIQIGVTFLVIIIIKFFNKKKLSNATSHNGERMEYRL